MKIIDFFGLSLAFAVAITASQWLTKPVAAFVWLSAYIIAFYILWLIGRSENT